jgi:hypothetical protein
MSFFLPSFFSHHVHNIHFRLRSDSGEQRFDIFIFLWVFYGGNTFITLAVARPLSLFGGEGTWALLSFSLSSFPLPLPFSFPYVPSLCAALWYSCFRTTHMNTHVPKALLATPALGDEIEFFGPRRTVAIFVFGRLSSRYRKRISISCDDAVCIL